MTAPTEMRHEVKMVVPVAALPQVRVWLRVHRAGFSAAYPRRTVNNIYFDTLDLASYAENLAGVARRVKLRLRWYGEDPVIRNGVLELKCKQGLAGWKRAHRVSSIMDLTAMRWSAIVRTLRADAPPRFARALDVAGHAVVINRYARDYLVSNDKTVRITVDSPQSVFSQRATSRPNLTFRAPPRDLIVIEAKAGVRHRDRLADVLGDLPVVPGRHSKYVLAVQGGRL